MTALTLTGALAAPAMAQHTLVLANGDRLSGRLRQVAGTTWVFTYRGSDLRILVDNITGLETTDPIGLRLTDGTVLATPVRLRGDTLVLEPAAAPPRPIEPRDIAAVGDPARLETLRPVDIGLFSPLLRFWGATGSLGFSDKRGNSRARGVTASIELARRSPQDRLQLGAGITREEAQLPGGTYETTVSKSFAFLQVDIYVHPRLFVTSATRLDRDRFQDLDLRSTYSAGLGFQAIQTERSDLRFNLLGGARREQYFSADGVETVPIMAVGAALRQELGPLILAWRVDWTPDAGAFHDYRLVSNGTVTTRIFKALGLRVSLLNEYNSRPRPGVQPHDMLVATTLTYAVGR